MTTETQNNEELIPTVPAFLLEAEAYRNKRIIRYLAIGWAVSAAALAVPLFTVLGRVWG